MLGFDFPQGGREVRGGLGHRVRDRRDNEQGDKSHITLAQKEKAFMFKTGGKIKRRQESDLSFLSRVERHHLADGI